MALDINTLKKAAEGAMYVSDKRLYVTASGELAEAGDERLAAGGARLLVVAGGSIPAKAAAKFGLIADARAGAVLAEAAAAVGEADAGSSEEDADEVSAKPIGRMTKAELLELAASRGLDAVDDGWTVAEIREALGEAEE